MTKKFFFVLLFFLLLLGLVLGSCSKAQAQSRPDRWEYTIIDGRLRDSDTLTEANKLGAEGWELVSSESDYRTIVFKRMLP